MTQKEFEERTGLKIPAEAYTEVEQCYMNTDLDKDLFCKLWIENHTALKEIESKTVLVRELYEERKRSERESYLNDRRERIPKTENSSRVQPMGCR